MPMKKHCTSSPDTPAEDITMVTRDEALTILRKYNKDPFHIKHAFTEEAVM